MLLEYLFSTAKEESLILVLDEYPYLRENVKGIDSILQSLIDKYRDTSKLKLILCGSYVDTMKSLLMRENPLYGRVDLTIDVNYSAIELPSSSQKYISTLYFLLR